MYEVKVFFESEDNIHKDKIECIDSERRKAILEKAFSTFYKRNVEVDYIK